MSVECDHTGVIREEIFFFLLISTLYKGSDLNNAAQASKTRWILNTSGDPVKVLFVSSSCWHHGDIGPETVSLILSLCLKKKQ